MSGSFTTRKAHCPTCGTELSGASPVEVRDALPDPGDLSVCLYCAELLEFNMDLTLSVLSANTIAALPADTRQALLRTQHFIRFVNADKPRRGRPDS